MVAVGDNAHDSPRKTQRIHLETNWQPIVTDRKRSSILPSLTFFFVPNKSTKRMKESNNNSCQNDEMIFLKLSVLSTASQTRMQATQPLAACFELLQRSDD